MNYNANLKDLDGMLQLLNFQFYYVYILFYAHKNSLIL